MTLEDGEISISSTQTGASQEQIFKEVKAKIKSITDPRKLSAYVMEHVELVSSVPTGLLNTWQNIEGWKFYRRHSTVHFAKCETTTYSKNKLINQRIEALEIALSKLITVLGVDSKQIL